MRRQRSLQKGKSWSAALTCLAQVGHLRGLILAALGIGVSLVGLPPLFSQCREDISSSALDAPISGVQSGHS
jgi:hypothetical protein